MKKLAIIVITASCLLGACTSDEELPIAVPEGKVQVEFQLPNTLGNAVNGLQTRADNLLDAGKPWHTLPAADASLLPVGSTLWLSYAKQEGKEYGTPNLQGYVVGTSAGGYNTLYPCTTEIDSEGRLTIQPDEIGAPLYLETGTYKFKMISPAYPLNPDDMQMWVENGVYLYSTDGRYEETSAQPMEILINETGVQYIKLKPMISQVARFTFTIRKGTGVNTLEPLAAGIEISGLQNPYNHGGEGQLQYNWCSENIADTLVMRMGDKREWVTLPGEDLQTDADGTITGDIGVLPTLTMSTPVAVLINIAINGVPTQYMTLVNEMMLLHAHSYNLTWEISVEEGRINVVTWQNQSWVTDVTGG